MSSVTRDKEWTMPVPRAPHVSLADDEQRRLESIVRAHSTPQALSFRCQLILRAAAADRPSNLQVAQERQCDRHTVGRWRSRYLATWPQWPSRCPAPGSTQTLFPPPNVWT